MRILKTIQNLVEEAESPSDLITEPKTLKTFSNVDDAVNQFQKDINSELKKATVKIESIENLDDKKLYRFIITTKEPLEIDSEVLPSENILNNFVTSKALKVLGKALEKLNINPTQIHLLSSVERWKKDDNKEPKISYYIEVDFSPQV